MQRTARRTLIDIPLALTYKQRKSGKKLLRAFVPIQNYTRNRIHHLW
jgi:hypothetical protein